MARIQAPEAREIYNELNVTPAVLGVDDDGPVIRDINQNVLPEAKVLL